MVAESATVPSTSTPAPPVTPTGADAGVAAQRASTYAERRAKVMADMASEDHFTVLGETADQGSTPERAPEPKAETKAPPPDEEHGPDEKPAERPAATAQTEDDKAANNARRAQRDPNQNPEAAYRAELERLNRLLAETNAKLERSDGDNRILWEASERMKQIARETGAVAFSEIDDANRQAIINQNAIRQQAQQAAQQQEAQRQWQDQAWLREIADRNAYGRASRSDALTDVFAAISEAGLKVSKDDVVKEFNRLYLDEKGDEQVKAQVALWQHKQTPPELSRKHVDIAMKRNAELTVQHFTNKAVQELRDQHQDPPRYDRTQAYGGASNAAPVPREDRRDIPWKERVKRDTQAWVDSVDDDIRRLTG